MAESSFNRKFRKEMERFGIKIYRVESHATSPGIPDNFYIAPGGAVGWIEMKVENFGISPKRIEYRPQQGPWLEDYSRRGGSCWTMLYVYKSDIIFLLRGEDARIASVDIDRAPSLRTFRAAEPSTWAILAGILRGGDKRAPEPGKRA